MKRKSNPKYSPKQEDKKIAKIIKENRMFRNKILGAKHYLDESPTRCDRCGKKVVLPHFYEKNGRIVACFCTLCNNIIKPKRKFVHIIYTPMK